MKYSKGLIIFIIVINIIFTVFAFVMFYLTGNEPSALIAAWFSFTGIELINMAVIKKQKVKEKENGMDR